MDFLGIGAGELVLILVIALIVLGPSRLPGIARKLGKGARWTREVTLGLTRTVTRELDIIEKKEHGSTSTTEESQHDQ